MNLDHHYRYYSCALYLYLGAKSAIFVKVVNEEDGDQYKL